MQISSLDLQKTRQNPTIADEQTEAQRSQLLRVTQQSVWDGMGPLWGSGVKGFAE
jgi:hypothetical protein